MKKIDLIFGILFLVVLGIGFTHAGIVYDTWRHSSYLSSFPAEYAFLILVPYAAGTVLLCLAWLIIKLVKRRKAVTL